MKYPQIINSLIETDLYKFSMGQVIYHQYPDYMTTWAFRCRNKDVIFTKEMIDEIKEQIKAYCDLTFKEDELEYLAKLPWLKTSYINFLRLWKPRFEDFTIQETTEGCHLKIETDGTWLNTSMYEIPILAIVNEVYFRTKYDYNELLRQFKDKADNKIKALITGRFTNSIAPGAVLVGAECNIGTFSEFGLRRRLSGDAQEYIVANLTEMNPHFNSSWFVGTSNVLLAKKYGIKAVGTCAHELFQVIGQGNHMHNPAYSNHYVMQSWVKEFETRNGIALTDTIGTDVFLRDFNLTYATLFGGVRHDSGDPIVWGNKILNHYRKLGIDPKTKTLLFSDSLNFERAAKIYGTFKNRTNVAFGIGTYLANDTDVEPLNIVCKVVKCNGMDVAKLSDAEGKTLCENTEYIDYLKRTINWRLNNTND